MPDVNPSSENIRATLTETSGGSVRRVQIILNFWRKG
jgi:hypothetical protein